MPNILLKKENKKEKELLNFQKFDFMQNLKPLEKLHAFFCNSENLRNSEKPFWLKRPPDLLMEKSLFGLFKKPFWTFMNAN